MKNNPRMDPLRDLPPELADLDAELSELTLDERPSFGPELRNELARQWSRPAPVSHAVWRRPALAAVVAALAFTGIVVPPARASIVVGVQRIFDTFRDTEEDISLPMASPAVVREAASRGEITAPPPPLEMREGASDAATERVVDLPPFQPGTSSLPSLLDEEGGREMIRRHYPRALQDVGIGGSVNVLLWVDEDGAVDHVQVARSSGTPELDQAALRAAPDLRFRPAMRSGVPVGMWVEFDVVFEPPRDFRVLREPGTLETPRIPEVTGWQPPRSWTEAAVVPAPVLVESRDMLRVAMGAGEAELEAAFGPLDGILSGDAPAGTNVLRWRTEVTRALEEARARDPENPAPYLALARIRRKQGLRNDAQMLFAEGLKRAARGTRPVSPRLVAELAYESGRLARENWLGWRELGEIPPAELPSGRCPAAAGSPGGSVAAETLLAWNYSCAADLSAVLATSFVPREEGEGFRSEMLRSFVAAVEAYPAHVGANTEILLDLADREAWHPLLEGARRFAWASKGHPNALLLEALALHRLGRSEEAADRFDTALATLPRETSSALRDPRVLEAGAAQGDGEAFWRSVDPILSTTVNERRVEHLARAGYALLRFGALEADAAQVWVRYGRPGAIRAFGAGPGLRLEMWDYGQGPDVTFYRPAASQNGALTPEGEEYLRDLGGSIPHWYGSRARPLYLLPAQVARFRGNAQGATSVRVRFDVPEEFVVAGGREPLTVGVFLLDGDGLPAQTLRWTLEADQLEVDLMAPAGPGVSHVVVELFDPATGSAAGIRTALSPSLGGMSDLLLTDPADVKRDRLRRVGEGLRPRPSRTRLAGEQAGVFVELYDLPVDQAYSLRAQLVSARNGAAIPLAIRPAGEAAFSAEWLRRPVGAGVSAEFLTLDLRSVGPGPYTVRVEVELEDGVVLTRELPGVDRVEDGHGPEPLERPLEMT